MSDITVKDDEFVWGLKYRPRTVEECILPEKLKSDVMDFVSKGEVPNFLFAGPAGCGKTTLAYAIANELDCDLLYINASMENGIDVLRTKIQQFASTVSLTGNGKIVLLDEADYMNANSLQPALRGFIEAFSSNCRFILTANYKNRIIDPLQSRCNVVEFKFSNDDKVKMMGNFFKRVCAILKKEGVEYDKNVVIELIKKHFPDNRRILNELQKYSAGGVIDSGILVNLSDESYKALFDLMKNKKYTEIRKWVAKNISEETSGIFRKFYDSASEIMDKNSIPLLVLILAEYEYKSAFVADQEINVMACLTSILRDCNFK